MKEKECKIDQQYNEKVERLQSKNDLYFCCILSGLITAKLK